MKKSAEIPVAAACCLFLGGAQYFLYRVNFSEYFQGDAVFWLYYRFNGLADFLNAFFVLDVANWYRPLSNRTIPALFFPFFGLDPYGYHLVVFALFFATSCAVFFFARTLTGSLLAAFITAFYFSIHSNNVYTTFDFAFAPEIFYTFFYVVAAGCFLTYARSGSRKWYVLSAAAFVLSLMSKEAAVTLPATLVLLYVFAPAPLASWRDVAMRFARGVQAVWLHLIVLAAYMGYVVAYLGVGGGAYLPVLNRNVPANLTTAFYWAFNLRRLDFMPVREAPGFVVAGLIVFAIVLIVLIVRGLFGRDRRIYALGASWFVVALFPMALLDGIGPYYLFSAMTGFSLLAGVALAAAIRPLAARSNIGAAAVLAPALMFLWFACSTTIEPDMRGNTALGYAARWAEESASSVKASYAELPPGSRVYIFNESEPDLWRYQGLGHLFKLVYADPTIATLYRTLGHRPEAPESGRLVVMETRGTALVDVTTEFLADPGVFLASDATPEAAYADRPGVGLRVDPTVAVAGRDEYWIMIDGFGDDEVTVQYRIDGGPLAEFTFRLDPGGRARFRVSSMNTLGLYEFVGFRKTSEPEWIRSAATLRVIAP